MTKSSEVTSRVQGAPAIERLLSRWENKAEFVVSQASFELSVSQEKSSVIERRDLVLQVTTHTSGVSAKYPRGEIRVVCFDGEHDKDQSGEPIIGAITCIEGNLQIGLVLSKSAVSDLVASGVFATAATSRRFYVALWPSANLSSWNGEGQLWVKEATFVIRNDNAPKAT
jgi:hypothetical protein